MQLSFSELINIGSKEVVSINELIEIIAAIAKKKFSCHHDLSAPTGVRGRNSSNELIRKTLAWDYEVSLNEGLSETYSWISGQIKL